MEAELAETELLEANVLTQHLSQMEYLIIPIRNSGVKQGRFF
jgi:hypothetical protein